MCRKIEPCCFDAVLGGETMNARFPRKMSGQEYKLRSPDTRSFIKYPDLKDSKVISPAFPSTSFYVHYSLIISPFRGYKLSY
jgi:hypothetical protein